MLEASGQGVGAVTNGRSEGGSGESAEAAKAVKTNAKETRRLPEEDATAEAKGGPCGLPAKCVIL
jgi:hypothetical protein